MSEPTLKNVHSWEVQQNKIPVHKLFKFSAEILNLYICCAMMGKCECNVNK